MVSEPVALRTPPVVKAVLFSMVAPLAPRVMLRAVVSPPVTLVNSVPPLMERSLPAPVAPRAASPLAAVPATMSRPPLMCVPPV